MIIGMTSVVLAEEKSNNIISPFIGTTILLPHGALPAIGIIYERNIYRNIYIGAKLGYPLFANIMIDYYLSDDTSINIDIGILPGIGFTFLKNQNIFIEALPKMEAPSMGYILPINICYAYKFYF